MSFQHFDKTPHLLFLPSKINQFFLMLFRGLLVQVITKDVEVWQILARIRIKLTEPCRKTFQFVSISNFQVLYIVIYAKVRNNTGLMAPLVTKSWVYRASSWVEQKILTKLSSIEKEELEYLSEELSILFILEPWKI